jgi:hypothetical protein
MKRVCILAVTTVLAHITFAQALTFPEAANKLNCKTVACFDAFITSKKIYKLWKSTETMRNYTNDLKGIGAKYTFYEKDSVTEIVVTTFKEADFKGWETGVALGNFTLLNSTGQNGNTSHFYQSKDNPTDIVILVKETLQGSGGADVIKYTLSLGRKHG